MSLSDKKSENAKLRTEGARSVRPAEGTRGARGGIGSGSPTFRWRRKGNRPRGSGFRTSPIAPTPTPGSPAPSGHLGQRPRPGLPGLLPAGRVVGRTVATRPAEVSRRLPSEVSPGAVGHTCGRDRIRAPGNRRPPCTPQLTPGPSTALGSGRLTLRVGRRPRLRGQRPGRAGEQLLSVGPVHTVGVTGTGPGAPPGGAAGTECRSPSGDGTGSP